MTARFVAMTVMIAVLGGRADAQEAASDLSQLRVKPGDVLTVTDTSGQRVQGRLTRLDNLGLVLELRDTQKRQFDRHMVATIEKRDSLKNGTFIGLAAGFGLGALMVLDYPPAAPGAALFGAGIGAAIGAGIDAMIKGRQVIYLQSRTTVSVTPVVTDHRKGVVFTLRR